MPYIKSEEREKFKSILHDMPTPTSAGELNYLITVLCRRYLRQNGWKYEQLNAIVGALECAKLEFNRRMIGPYEDSKVIDNGDVGPDG